MPVPTSNISMSAINTEVTSVDSTSLRTLSANAIPAKSIPDGMLEFAGYTHTQSFSTPTYVRYYLGSSNSDPYAAFQTTISASTSDITSYVQDSATEVTNYGAICATYSTSDIRVLRSGSYYYLAIKLDGIGDTTSRYFYRESNQAQGPFSATFINIMRITPQLNPGSLQVGITQGSSTTTTNITGGSYSSTSASALDGDTTNGGNFSTYGLNDYQTLSNNQSVGARWRVAATAEALSGGSSFSAQRDSTSIFNVIIKASGYYDQQIASVMVRGRAFATATSTGGGGQQR